MPSDRPLTPKQQRFVEEYLIDLNATAAAARAGYSDPNKGRQLVTKSNVAESIQKAVSQRSERVKLDQNYVLQRLQIEAELAGEGASHSARVRAVELIGKHLGMFADKHEHKIEGSVSHEHRLTDEQRLAGFNAILARVGQAGLGQAQRPGSNGAGPHPG